MEIIKNNFYGVEVGFYAKNDGKYTVRVCNDAEATEKLLANCKYKEVKADKLHFFIKGIKEKIEDGVLERELEAPVIDEDRNPIIVLSELVQKKYGKNIETEVIGKRGFDHCPVIRVRITLPDGNYEEAVGSNQKIANSL